MYEHHHDKITVNATFLPDKRPQIHSFRWHEKDYLVKTVTLSVKARKGRETVWLYSVNTETAAFKLRLDSDTMTWYLEERTWELQTN